MISRRLLLFHTSCFEAEYSCCCLLFVAFVLFLSGTLPEAVEVFLRHRCLVPATLECFCKHEAEPTTQSVSLSPTCILHEVRQADYDASLSEQPRLQVSALNSQRGVSRDFLSFATGLKFVFDKSPDTSLRRQF